MTLTRADGNAQSVASLISTRMVQLMLKHTGRGPTRARATMAENLLVIVFEDALTRGETTLVAAGEGDAVARQRRVFDQVMRQEAIGVVEQLTGRRVRSLMSDFDPANNLAASVFVLEALVEIGPNGRVNGSHPAA
jgi:uncharacterized protein YbcI